MAGRSREPVVEPARCQVLWCVMLVVCCGCSAQEPSGYESSSLPPTSSEDLTTSSDQGVSDAQAERASSPFSESAPPENVVGAYLIDSVLEFCTSTADDRLGQSFCSVDVRAVPLSERDDVSIDLKQNLDLVVHAESQFEAEIEARNRFLAVAVTRGVVTPNQALLDVDRAASVYTLPGNDGRMVVYARYAGEPLDVFGGEEVFHLEFVAGAEPEKLDYEQFVLHYPQDSADLAALKPWLSAGFRVVHPDAPVACKNCDESEDATKETGTPRESSKIRAIERGRLRSLRSFAHHGFDPADFLPAALPPQSSGGGEQSFDAEHSFDQKERASLHDAIDEQEAHFQTSFGKKLSSDSRVSLSHPNP